NLSNRMATLIIDFFLHDPQLRIKGLSLKALKGSNIWQRIYKDPDLGGFYIDTRFKINRKTAKIEEAYLIETLKELIQLIPFDKIKIKNRYHLSGDEIMKLINQPRNRK